MFKLFTITCNISWFKGLLGKIISQPRSNHSKKISIVFCIATFFRFSEHLPNFPVFRHSRMKYKFSLDCYMMQIWFIFNGQYWSLLKFMCFQKFFRVLYYSRIFIYFLLLKVCHSCVATLLLLQQKFYCEIFKIA